MGTVSFTLKNKSVTVRPNGWVDIIRPLLTGKCFTSKTLGKLAPVDTIVIMLNNSLAYRVYLHDPDVFFVSLNPSGLPRMEIGLVQGLRKTAIQYLRVKKHGLLERSSAPCRHYEEEQSSMISCIEMKIVNDSGCKVRPPVGENIY